MGIVTYLCICFTLAASSMCGWFIAIVVQKGKTLFVYL